MEQIRLARQIAAPVDAVWSIVSDFGGVHRWISGLRCTVEGSGIGSQRTIIYPDGREVRERLVAFDESRRTLRYNMLSVSPILLRNLEFGIQVRPGEESGWTIVEWAVYGDRDDALDISEPLQSFLVRTLDRIDRLKVACLAEVAEAG